MNNEDKVSEAIRQLDHVYKMARTRSDAMGLLCVDYARNVLSDIRVKINTIEGKRIVAEGQRDALLMAIAGTNEGRELDINDSPEVMEKAMRIVRSMDNDIRTSREAEEIPFGAVEQDREKMELEKRVAELELQLETKVDECTAKDNQLILIKQRCKSLLSRINIVVSDADGVNVII